MNPPRECPACSVPMSAVGSFPELSRDGSATLLARYGACDRCGLIGKTDMPPEGELRDYYENSWQYATERPLYREAAEFIERGVRLPVGVGPFPGGFDSAHPIGNKKCLDVGAKGDAMAHAIRAVGIAVDGAKLDAQARDGVEAKWLGSGDGPDGDYSFVTATHVLEHVLRPDLFLRDLASLTAYGGFIYVEVPSLRGGSLEPGLCDDINRNHLWHFTPAALVVLGSSAGLHVASQETSLQAGWPVERILYQNSKPSDASALCWLFSAQNIRSEYQKAGVMLHGEDPATTALYGASHSYAMLRHFAHARVLSFKLYDRYKAGQEFKRTPILHPDHMKANDIQRVVVTCRSYNSFLDIKKDLAERYPWLTVLSPYANIEEACA